MALDDVVILNVDTNTLETPFDDLQSLPNDVVGDCLESGGGERGTIQGHWVYLDKGLLSLFPLEASSQWHNCSTILWRLRHDLGV